MPNDHTVIKEHELSDSERDRLHEALPRIAYSEQGPFNPFVRCTSRTFSAAITGETSDVLHEFKNSVRASGVLAIHNTPFDRNVQRGLLEGEAAHQAKTNWLSEALLVGAVSQVGEPYSIHQEEPALVNNLCPSQKDLMQYTGLGSRAPLGLHIENAAARLLDGDRSPDGLALTGVSREPDKGPATVISNGRLALSLCDRTVERELRKKNFAVRFPNRWSTGEANSSRRTRALEGPKENPSFVAAFYDNILTALTPKAEKALAEFAAALEAVSTAVHIEPGLLILLNNHFVFHGRGSFEAAFDEGRPYRWVQRVFWTSTLRRMGEWEWVRDRVVRPRVEPKPIAP